MTPYFLEDEKREMIEKTEHLTESELSKECIEKLYMYGWKKKTLSRTTRTALWKACHGRYGRYSWKYCAAIKKKKSCGLSGQVYSKSLSTFSAQYKRWDVRNHHKQFFLRTMSSISPCCKNASGAFNKQKKINGIRVMPVHYVHATVRCTAC